MSSGNFQVALCPESWEASNMAKDLKSRVSERLAELNRNPTDAAKRGGLERTFLVDILHGRKKSVRGDNLQKLAAALDWSTGQTLGQVEANRPATVQKALADITPDDFERLKLACAYFVESFSEVEGAMQWIEALEQVVQMRKGEKRPIDREQFRAKAEAIADLAKAGLRPENRQGT